MGTFAFTPAPVTVATGLCATRITTPWDSHATELVAFADTMRSGTSVYMRSST